MAGYKGTSGPSSEVLRLQEEITREVNNDAEHLATAVFGKPGNMPDMARVSDEEITARYRAAYTNNDRQYLTQEAQRDPEQFVKVARQIGVKLPEELGQGQDQQPLELAMPAPAPVPAPVAMPPPVMAPPPPFAPPMPMPPPVPPAVPPVLGA